MRRMLIALGCLAILVVAFLLWPLPRKCHNHFILPQGFRGAIRFDSSVSDGLSIPRDKDGNLIIQVPRSGRVRLRGPSPFQSYCGYSAEWENGASIPSNYPLDSPNESSFVLWTLYTLHDGSFWMYLGPRAEYLDAVSRGGQKLEPGRAIGP